jgi:guanylate kinase
MQNTGSLFVVSAPSGAGKSSMVKALLAGDARLGVSVSHTTRAPRGQEQNGREYHFVDRVAFQSMVADGDFVEWAEVHGNLYGTSRSAIETQVAQGHDVVLEIDWQGALQLKALVSDAVLIFILPPSWEELARRLNLRAEDTPDVIAQRLVNARLEVAQARHFDFVIINSTFETAVFDLKTIVQAQRLRYSVLRQNQSAVFQALNLA